MNGEETGEWNEGTRSQEVVFEELDDTVQIGCGGLHGCTVMTLASNKAAYMVSNKAPEYSKLRFCSQEMLTHNTLQAHYWEVYALNNDDDLTEGSIGELRFKTRVLDAIDGTATQDPLTVGSGVTWSNYNGEGDNTRLFIMTPAVDDWRGKKLDGEGPETWKYMNKVEKMTALVEGKIPGVAIKVVPYKRLNYSNNGGQPTGPDKDIVGTNARGMAYFQ